MRRYTEEEKVESLGSVSLVAKKHGMLTTTIQNWIRKGASFKNTGIKKMAQQRAIFMVN